MTHKRKKILYVITKSVWGGAQRYVFDLAVELGNEYDVSVACGGEGLLVERLREKGIRTISVPAFQRDIDLSKEFRVFVDLWKLFRKEKPDIVHLNSSKAGGLGALAAHLAGVDRVIFTSHGLPFEEDRPRSQKNLIWLATWVTFLFSHTVIVISRANRDAAARMPFIQNRLVLVPLGIPSPSFLSRDDARKEIAEMLGRTPETLSKTWIGTIAEFTKNKGLSYCIDAVHDIIKAGHDIVLILIGDGELKESLHAQIRNRGLEDRVYTVKIPSDAARFLHAFDIGVLSSVKEGVPYVLLEMGYAELPFAGSAIPGIQEVVTDMESGVLVRAKHPQELAGALTLLLTDEARRKNYAYNLKNKVIAEYTKEALIEKTRKVYERK